MTSLAVLLKSRGLKQIDLARRLGVDKGTVSRWDRNGVPADRLSAIEEKAGIPPHEVRPDLASIFQKKEDASDE